MPRRLAQDPRLRPLRKRSISDSNLHRFEASFCKNISTNITDVLDFKSKSEYYTIQEQPKENSDEEIIGEEKVNEEYPSPTRKRRSGLVSLRNSFSRFVGTRISLRRQTFQPNDPRQLIFAIRNQDINRVRNILDTCPVDVNGSDSKGVTATHEAALDGQWEIIALLLQHNADVSIKDNEGLTCLDYAVFGGHFECAEFLIENGATTLSVRDGMPTYFTLNDWLE